MEKCVFTGKEATKHTEQWAFERGYLHQKMDDLQQIRENPYVLDGNETSWSLMIDGKLITIRRESSN